LSLERSFLRNLKFLGKTFRCEYSTIQNGCQEYINKFSAENFLSEDFFYGEHSIDFIG